MLSHTRFVYLAEVVIACRGKGELREGWVLDAGRTSVWETRSMRRFKNPLWRNFLIKMRKVLYSPCLIKKKNGKQWPNCSKNKGVVDAVSIES